MHLACLNGNVVDLDLLTLGNVSPRSIRAGALRIRVPGANIFDDFANSFSL